MSQGVHCIKCRFPDCWRRIVYALRKTAKFTMIVVNAVVLAAVARTGDVKERVLIFIQD